MVPPQLFASQRDSRFALPPPDAGNHMKRRFFSLLSVGLLVACSDSSLDLKPVSGLIANSISEGRSGGNPELFFAAPLATSPQAGDVNFDVGGSNGAVVPYLRVCETNGAPTAAGCVTDVTQTVTGSASGLAMAYGATSELYQVNWQTKALDASKDYRIEIWGLAFATAAEKAALDPRWLFGWIDIRNSPEVSSCTGAEPFCMVKYGQTLPVKVRIEQYVFCPVSRNCAMQFVAPGVNANLEAKLDPATGAPSAQLFIPAQAGTGFALAFEPCTAAEDAAVSEAIDLPTFGPCLKTATTFTGSLGTAAIVSLCDAFDPEALDLSHDQGHQLALHHFKSDLSLVTALPEAWQCGTATSGSVASRAPSGFRQLAGTLRTKLLAWASPRPLYAAARKIDLGGGGETFDIASFFKLALPAKFEYVSATDASQTALAGSAVVLRAKVTDLHGEVVKNARVRWTVFSSPSPGATVLSSTPVLTNASGIAEANVQLSSSSGFNVFRASGRGIAANGSSECAAPSSSTGTCNGPRASFDPFNPFHLPELDAVGDGYPVNIAEGTRLPFTVFGCTPGFGSATVDGSFSAAEWACARTFQFTANVSGGSTPATLYVMNDNARLYLAVRLQRNASDKVNTLQFNFDNNGSWATGGAGAAETGDDILSLSAATGLTDAHLTLKCVNSSQSSCWSTDASAGGANDGSGAFKNDGVYTTYELAHPLNSPDDAHDFSLLAGAKVGLFLTLQTGSGAAGNTQWPGFRKYQEIRIEP